MTRYILRRLLQSLPTLFGITLITFLLMSAAPGGPVAALATDPRATPEQQQRLAASLGANDPWYTQYINWLIGDDWQLRDKDGDGKLDGYGTRQGILRGDFGHSYYSNRPVLELIGERIPATLELGGVALLLGLGIGVPVGILAAVTRGSAFDNFTRVFAVIVRSVPGFWLGLILILVFGAQLKWLPMGGRCPTALMGCPPLLERLNHIILPASVLAAGGIAVYSRYLRASMLDVINQDYVRTARSKGLRRWQIWFGHAARNALVPLATILGPTITGLLGGAVITETIFSWPGLGRQTFQAVVQKDYPLVMAGVIIAAAATVLGFLLSDILYAIVDPRIRFQ